MSKLPNLKMDYVEFYSPRLEATEAFFTKAFGWSYVEYGPDYRDIQNAGLGGGIERAETGCPLVVLKADDLEAALLAVREAGGEVVKDIFEFPGGKRFEFVEPGGTRLAVWSEP